MSRRSKTTGAILDAHRWFGKLDDDVSVDRWARAQQRRRGIVTVACLAAGALIGFAAALVTPQHWLFRQPNLPRSSVAFFEFAPQSGTGMGAACACTTPSGAKGEAMTFTRASSGTCLKGNTTSGIANGDMVTCSTNQARVMPGGDGSGGLGLLVEGARTDLELRSQEFDNAAWTKEQDAAPRTPTVTADQATAPDGTLTADRLQSVATSGVQYSEFYQQFNVSSAAAASCSIFVKGNGTSGTTDLCLFDGATWTCPGCVYAAATWTRCVASAASGTATARFCKFGNNSLQNGGVARNAADVFAWGLQGEEGTFASSYIATAGATVTRAVDAVSLAFDASQIVSLGSAAATFVPNFSGALSTVYLVYFDANGRALYSNTGAAMNIYDGTNDNSSGAYSFVAGTAARAYSYWGTPAGKDTVCIGAVCNTNATFDNTMGAGGAAVNIGAAAGVQSNGVVKQICIDQSPTRCR